ncbi:YiiX/YebB-like N1pC/P60 family cysteine hydrolase [Rubellicoccus peritrichatus]|uniref:YiiX/YebB-like N1pC/P60 family cysteine hydrolase n=1 Tax=Rubellicoccus peritrichatus TaxID=3080537 RepID=A0AAQ3QTH1_9BACT|nr:YiiX/YebB-like N1pC/P60 family cysteine hydrolase [Puniceicoccus sp. CR14]WOO41341.1 YiiX/YebB-like N1pC/P60 family cysteine hydrolase [Puniceicoccus sp. CR14]
MKTAEALTYPENLLGQAATDTSGLNAWLSIQLHRWVARLVHLTMTAGELVFLLSPLKIGNRNTTAALKLPSNAKAGDLVFAVSNSLRARCLRRAFPDTGYTHVGVLVGSKDCWKIVHARPGTLIHRFRDGGVCEDTWEHFVQESDISDLTIFRAKGSNTEAISKLAKQTAESGQRFDICYELSRQDAVYCTEFIWRLGLAFGQDWVEDRFMRFRFLWLSTKAIRPEAITSSQYLDPIRAH